MTRFPVSWWTNLCAFGFAVQLLAVQAVRADEPLPSQEDALARVLASHPDIVAAKAKVALAEAELYGKRMEASRQVLELYGSLNVLDAQIAASKAALSQSEAEFARVTQAKGAVDQSRKDRLAAEVQAAQAQLVLAVGKRAQVESELRLLCGSATAEAEAPRSVAVSVRQQPQGPIVEKLKTAAEKMITLEFIETPLEAILEVLSAETDVMFSAQRQSLEAFGWPADAPISLHTSEVRVLDALQAFEDAYPDLQFVVRDYGVLLTTRDYAEERGYMPVLELGQRSDKAAQ